MDVAEYFIAVLNLIMGLSFGWLFRGRGNSCGCLQSGDHDGGREVVDQI